MATKTETKDCPVCYEEIEKEIKCPNVACKFTICTKCMSDFITKNPIKRASCVKCNEIFELSFLANHFGHLFTFSKSAKKVNYRTILQNVYLEEQLARLYLYQEKYTEYRSENDAIKARVKNTLDFNVIDAKLNKFKVLTRLKNIAKKLEKELGKEIAKNDPFYKETMEEIKLYSSICDDKEKIRLSNRKVELCKEGHEISKKLNKIRQDKWDREHNRNRNGGNQTNEQVEAQRKAEEEEESKNKVLCNCPVTDCNGFVMKEQGKHQGSCGVCNVVVCSKCLESKEENHKCDVLTLANVKAIKEDSKKCPNCFAFIFKSQGCSQMFCTKCHILFDYNTLKIVKNTEFFHNPHYTEFRQQMTNGVNHVDNCQPLILQIRNRKYSHVFHTVHYERAEANVRKVIEHIDENHIVFNEINNETTKTIEKLTFDYFDKKITKDEFGALLFKMHKANSKIELVHEVYQMLNELLKDVFVFLSKEYEKEKEKEKLFIEFNKKLVEIVRGVNDHVNKSLKLFAMTERDIKVYNIDEVIEKKIRRGRRVIEEDEEE